MAMECNSVDDNTVRYGEIIRLTGQIFHLKTELIYRIYMRKVDVLTQTTKVVFSHRSVMRQHFHEPRFVVCPGDLSLQSRWPASSCSGVKKRRKYRKVIPVTKHTGKQPGTFQMIETVDQPLKKSAKSADIIVRICQDKAIIYCIKSGIRSGGIGYSVVHSLVDDLII